MAAAAAAVTAAAAVVAPPPVFALTPALVNQGVVDYSSSEGMKVFKAATSELNHENPFNCAADELRSFLGLIADRARDNGWDQGILTVPDDNANPLGPAKNLLQHYGEITLDHVREYALTYIFTQTEQRKTQGSSTLPS